MIVHIPEFQGKGSGFAALNRYVTQPHKDKEQEQQHEGMPEEEFTRVDDGFSALVNYISQKTDAKDHLREKCTAIRTHGLTDIANATMEMNAVASQNSRVKDPAYHFILSWPEHERPSNESVFSAAEHALKALGLQEHQCVMAIHSNTDNLHCHISVNRVHPVTFKSRHLEWSKNTLHLAARQSEIEHGWSHDNGNYIVQERGGKKIIAVNPDYAQSDEFAKYLKYQSASKNADSRGSRGKDDPINTISRKLKKDISSLTNWQELHSWFEQHNITLINTGGGGMRLKMNSPETGESLEIAASTGFRFLTRTELEQRWGAFQKSQNPIPTTVPLQVTDTAHLTAAQIQQGVNHVLTLAQRIQRPRESPDPYRPPDHLIRAAQRTDRAMAQASNRLRKLPTGSVDDDWGNAAMPLQDAVSNGVGNAQATAHSDVRRPRASQASSRSSSEIKPTREERKQQRAAARADLRARYGIFVSQIQQTQQNDTDYQSHAAAIQSARSATLKTIRQENRNALRAIPKNASLEYKLMQTAEITRNTALDKLAIEAKAQTELEQLKATRIPIPGWKEWLHEQAQWGDQAAVSALRGIAYQAQRDKKTKNSVEGVDDSDTEFRSETDAQKYQRIITQLLEEEKRERSIRAANIAQRPWEAEALLRQYAETQWRVTGNGNVEYRTQDNDTHLFTDRGNRLTFDKATVTDAEIRLALIHAQAKFGQAVMLTGDDRVFSERMAKIAAEMNIGVLNPELQDVMKAHQPKNGKRKTSDFGR